MATVSASSDPGLVRIEDLLDKAGRYCDEQGLDLLHRAYVFSAEAHEGQTRRSGEPYLVHPLAVADILVDMKLDADAAATGLLHDVIEDTLTDAGTLEEMFGPTVARMVEGVTKISRIELKSREAQQAESFRKMLLAMVDDVRVIIVKLADRLHNMRTLRYLPAGKRQRIAPETLDIYAPIANRLGMGRIRGELEDISFEHLMPDEFAELTRRIEDKRRVSEEFINSVRERLAQACRSHSVPAEIESRVKGLYSIYQKMKRQRIPLEEVHDYIAFRLLVKTVKDCYGLLGVVHGIWTPIPGRIKDYIAMPKPNFYQSLHTTLMGDSGHTFEVQIRTHDMNRVAEEGIAAHWSYKEGRASGADEARTYAWLRGLVEHGKELSDPTEFLESLRVDLYPDEVYTFTPAGKVLSFPRGSTGVDFAYAIHTEVGNQCVGAKVNGKLVPLRTPLRNGDIVEILTDKSHRPSRDWLKIVVTSRARTKIRQWLNNEARKRSEELGKSLIDREIKRAGLGPRALEEHAELETLLTGFGLAKLDDVYAAVGYGKLEARSLVARLVRPDATEAAEPEPPTEPARARATPGGGIEVRGYGDMLVALARCCKPIPGDAIVGYITRGRGVSVHARDCRNVRHLMYDPGRRIDVAWAGERPDGLYQVGLRIQTEDQPGMLAKISARVAGQNTNIRAAQANTFEDKKGVIRLTLEIPDLAHLEAICRSIAEIDGVIQVDRISS